MEHLITSQGLADLLGVAKGTIHNRWCLRPETLPPALVLPGFQGPRWTMADVVAWLEKHRAQPAPRHPQPAAPRRRGRPRKTAATK